MPIITGAKVIVTCPGRNFVTVKVVASDGVHGLGDATLNGRELAVHAYLQDHVIPCLIGRDPAQTEDIWQYLYRGAYWRRGPVTMTAIAAPGEDEVLPARKSSISSNSTSSAPRLSKSPSNLLLSK